MTQITTVEQRRNSLLKVNQLNKLYREFFTLSDEKMGMEKMEINNDMTYAQKLQLINQLTTQIDEVRREIKMLKNEDREYNLAEIMQAVHSYVMATTIFNKSVTVTSKMKKNSNKFNAAVIKNDGSETNILVTVQNDGTIFSFEGSVIRHISEFVK